MLLVAHAVACLLPARSVLYPLTTGTDSSETRAMDKLMVRERREMPGDMYIDMERMRDNEREAQRENECFVVMGGSRAGPRPQLPLADSKKGHTTLTCPRR